jgi:hypothetical protein
MTRIFTLGLMLLFCAFRITFGQTQKPITLNKIHSAVDRLDLLQEEIYRHNQIFPPYSLDLDSTFFNYVEIGSGEFNVHSSRTFIEHSDDEKFLNGDIDNKVMLNATNYNADLLISFVKNVTAPEVSTNSISGLSCRSATSGGNITSDGGEPVTARGVVWGTVTNPTLSLNEGFTSNGEGTGSSVSELTGLASSTTYYVRAYAINSAGISYGTEWEFTTLSSGVFAGGEGTSDNPFQVETPEHLNDVRNYLGAGNADVHFLQISDIDLGVSPWNEYPGWAPIGDFNNRFFGKYDGGGHTIQGLYTETGPYFNYMGLFGMLDNSKLSNIIITDANVTGNQNVGILSGFMQNGSQITNCHTSGSVTANSGVGGLVGRLQVGCIVENSSSSADVIPLYESSGSYFGGLVGYSVQSEVNTCSATGNVNGLNYLGGLVGYSYQSDVNTCFANGNVTGQNYLGGIIGSFSQGNVSMSYASGNVFGQICIGGLIGTFSGFVSNCYATGEVKGYDRIGGLIGCFVSEELTSCYSVGRVTYTGNGGGLVGFSNISAEESCYWNIETSGHDTSALGTGRLTPVMLSQSNFSGWDFDNIWSINPGSSYPYLKWQVNPESFNFPPSYIPPWGLKANPGNGSIMLTWNAPSQSGITSYRLYRDGSLIHSLTSTQFNNTGLANYTYYSYTVQAVYGINQSSESPSVSAFSHQGFSGGDGTEENPYLVSNAGELFTVRQFLDSHFRQTANINLGESPWIDGEGWKPIGDYSLPFVGSYDGDGYTVNSLTVIRPAESYVGLFGLLYRATIKNINLENYNITGSSYVGGICGYLSYSSAANINLQGQINGGGYVGGGFGLINYSSVSSSLVNSEITGTSYVGGLGGSSTASKITKCETEGSITSSASFTGGICGYISSTSINSCFSGSDITSTGDNSGGIVGLSNGSIVSNSYSFGVIAGRLRVGGLMGTAQNYSRIYNSYSFGNVSGEGNVGGLVGIRNPSNPSTVTNSYWNTTLSGIDVSEGGEGRTSSEMTYPYASNTYVNWDYNNTWSEDIGPFVNGGYPYLQMLEFDIPEVLTNTPSRITWVSAQVGGNVTSDGDKPVTARGVVYSKSVTYVTLEDSFTVEGEGTGEFVSQLTDLTPGTQYWYRSYATNVMGTSYGTPIYGVLTPTEPNNEAFLTSEVYEINQEEFTITLDLYMEELEAFHSNVLPAPGATYQIFESDGTTPAEDLQSDYKVVVIAQDGIVANTYTLSLKECIDVVCITPKGAAEYCHGVEESEYRTYSPIAASFIWEIYPEEAGEISSSDSVVVVKWNPEFIGAANIRVRGVQEPCNSIWSDYFNVDINPLPAELTINGLSQACQNEKFSEYWVGPSAGIDYDWYVENATIVSGQGTNKILVNWGTTSGEAKINLTQTFYVTGCFNNYEMTVNVSTNTAPPIPEIHVKGRINILICLIPDLSYYRWYKDGNLVTGATNQFYVARNNVGSYRVEICDDFGCMNRSEEVAVSQIKADASPLYLYPNPTKNTVNVDLEWPEQGEVRVSVFDVYGYVKQISTFRKDYFFFVEDMSIDNLSRGTYLVKIELNGMLIDSKLMVVY